MRKDELVEGQIYEVESNQFFVAVWTGHVFQGPILKDGQYQLIHEGHFDDGLPLGTAKAVRPIGDMLVPISSLGASFLATMVALNEEVSQQVKTRVIGR